MNWLIISCNPNPNSFSESIVNSIRDTILEDDKVLSYNLYDTNFNPILSHKEFTENANQIHKNIELLEDDIKTQLENIIWADVIIFVYPVWWMQMPALMKGYTDRIFSHGYILHMLTNLFDKRIISFVTAGLSKEEQKQKKIDLAYKVILNDFIYFLTGRKGVLKIFSNINKVGNDSRIKYLEEVKMTLKTEIYN